MENNKTKEAGVELRDDVELNTKKRPINDDDEEKKDAKRQNSNDEPKSTVNTVETSNTKKEDLDSFDVAKDMKLIPGSRIEVQWEVHFDDDENVTTRWWGGTLLSHDGRMHTFDDERGDQVTVPIRVIDYDPYEEGGFPDRSLEDVCFLTDHTLHCMESDSSSYWRLEREQWEPTVDIEDYSKKMVIDAGGVLHLAAVVAQSEGCSNETLVENLVGEVLKSAIENTGVMDKMKKLNPSQQAVMAEKIVASQKMFGDKLLEQMNKSESNEITEDTLAKVSEEFSKGL